MKTLLIYIHLNGNLMFFDWNINDYNINDIVKIVEFLCSFLRTATLVCEEFSCPI